MLNDLSPAAHELADLMSELSEEGYYADWMENLEHALWQAVGSGPFRYGHLDLTDEHVAALKRLSGLCGGWVYFDEATEETFVPLEQWKQMYDAARANKQSV